jgi:hypothetical protein
MMGEKFWIQDFETGLDRKLALTEAIEDIKRYWRSYRKTYEEKYYEKR